MATVFSRILAGEIPCHKLLEDDRFLAFLEKKPVNRGHALVIPKREVDYLFDLDDETLGSLMAFAKIAAKAVRETVPCKKIGVMVAGLEVRHAHVHLVPIFESVSELSFARAKEAPESELESLALEIRKRL